MAVNPEPEATPAPLPKVRNCAAARGDLRCQLPVGHEEGQGGRSEPSARAHAAVIGRAPDGQGSVVFRWGELPTLHAPTSAV